MSTPPTTHHHYPLIHPYDYTEKDPYRLPVGFTAVVSTASLPGDVAPAHCNQSVDALQQTIAALQASALIKDKECRDLRRMLCIASSDGCTPYLDDGEASDASQYPFIDYLRDSVQEIRDKQMKRHRAWVDDYLDRD